MGIPEGTVLARAKREGWTRQVHSAKAPVKREDAVVATPVEAVAQWLCRGMRQRAERHAERMAGVSERAVDHIERMDGSRILRSIDEIEKLDKVARRTFRLDDIQPGTHFTLNVLRIDGSMRPEEWIRAHTVGPRPWQSLAISRCNQCPPTPMGSTREVSRWRRATLQSRGGCSAGSLPPMRAR
jgi:hypothetical protein